MKYLLPILCLLTVFQAQGQTLPLNYDTLVGKNEIVLTANADYSASAIQRTITSKFYRGGFIDDEMKNASLDRHKAVNRAGMDVNAELIYYNYAKKIFKKKPWGFLVKAGDYNFGGFLYSKDFFGLAFYGNKKYQGDTLNMSGTDISFTSFQKVGFGLVDPKSKSSLTFNFYNVSNRISGDFRALELGQSESGDEISLVMDGEVEQADNKNFIQGIGFGIDVDYKLPFHWKEGKTAYVQFLAQNVGVAHMNQRQKSYSFDTSFVFTGLEFDQIIGDESIIGDSLDLLDTLGIKSSLRNRTILLPGFLQVAKIVDENSTSKFQSFFGIRMYPTLIYNPYVFAGLDFKPIQSLHVGLSASYGGFARFKAGLYASYRSEKLSIGIGTENLIGLVSPKGNGESVNLRVGVRF